MDYTEIEIEGMKEILRDKEKEIKKLNEFKTKREESMFYFKAQMERAEPKTAREAEDLQRAKELFEKLYREELSCLEQENKKLREENDRLKNNAMEDMKVQTGLEEKIRFLEECLDNKEKVNKSLREELENLKEKLSQYEN